METSSYTAPKHNKTKEIIVGIICLFLFAGIYYYTLTQFNKESDTNPTILKDDAKDDKDYIQVGIQVVNVDPVKGDIQARMNFKLHGSYTDDDGSTLNKEVTLYINSVSGKNEHQFTKGKRMNPVDFTLEMFNGIVTDYPFDSHDADLEMLMVTKEKNDSGTTTESTVSVIKEVDFKASVHGFTVDEVREPGDLSDYTDIGMHIERTKSVLYFSIFVMILMWAIIIAVVLIMLSIIVRNRKIEYSMFGFLATLLFALPALRNLQPFVPGIGCMSDYIAFFWAEGIAAGGLILMIFIWLKRPGVKQT
jgi:hypothetical protein